MPPKKTTRTPAKKTVAKKPAAKPVATRSAPKKPAKAAKPTASAKKAPAKAAKATPRASPKKAPARAKPAALKPAPRKTPAVEKPAAVKAAPKKPAAVASEARPATPRARGKKAPQAESLTGAAPSKKRLNATQERTTGKLVRLAGDVLRQVQQRQGPTIAIRSRTLANTYYDERRKIVKLGDEKTERAFFNMSMAKKFMQTFLVAGACKELVESGKTTSIRDLYYMTKHTLGGTKLNTFDDQSESDPIIEDLEVTADALREELHLYAKSAGSIAGAMTVVDSGDTIDLRRMGSSGWTVPSIVEPENLQFKKHEAEFVLLLEKDAVWRRFNEDKFWKTHNCLIVHGGGQPPRGVRRLLRRLNEELGLPVYVLVDNDPWGFYIYSVIKQGSINLAYESMRMAVPSAKFVGLSAYDREKYDLPDNVTIALQDNDVSRARQMLEYKWFDKPKWHREINYMLKSGVKLELEALSAKGISFITEQYVPRKLSEKDWLD